MRAIRITRLMRMSNLGLIKAVILLFYIFLNIYNFFDYCVDLDALGCPADVFFEQEFCP